MGKKKYTKTDLAEQQLLGFKHAQTGYSLTDLVDGMGLTLIELDEIESEYGALYEDYIPEIREYLLSEKKVVKSEVPPFKIQLAEHLYILGKVIRVHSLEVWRHLLNSDQYYLKKYPDRLVILLRFLKPLMIKLECLKPVVRMNQVLGTSLKHHKLILNG